MVVRAERREIYSDFTHSYCAREETGLKDTHDEAHGHNAAEILDDAVECHHYTPKDCDDVDVDRRSLRKVFLEDPVRRYLFIFQISIRKRIRDKNEDLPQRI